MTSAGGAGEESIDLLPLVYGVQGMAATGQKGVEGHREAHGWRYPRAPSVKWLWREESTEAVLKLLKGTREECISTRRRLPDERYEDAGSGDEGEEGGPGPPAM